MLFPDVGAPCEVFVELFGDEKGLTLVGGVSAIFYVSKSVSTVVWQRMFGKESGFSDLLRAPDLLRRSKEYQVLNSVSVEYRDLSLPRFPTTHYGFEVNLEFSNGPAPKGLFNLMYRVGSGLDETRNIIANKKERASGYVLQRLPREERGMVGDPVSGPGRASFFVFTNDYWTGEVP